MYLPYQPLLGIVFLGPDTTSFCPADPANYDSQAGGDRGADEGNISADEGNVSADNARGGSTKEDGGADGNGHADSGTNRHIGTARYGRSNGDGGAAVTGRVGGVYPATTGQPGSAADTQPVCDVYVQPEPPQRQRDAVTTRDQRYNNHHCEENHRPDRR